MREEHRSWVFEKGLLRSIFENKGAEVKRGWRKLHNVKLNNLFCPPDITGMIKPRKVRWTGHVACAMMRNAYKILLKCLKETEHSEALDLDGRILLKLVLRNWSGTV